MTVATQAFRWTEMYKVNIEVLDRQHQGLFDTVNELNSALASGDGEAVTAPILRKLVEYAQTHFTTEEALMRKYNFCGLVAHKTEHDEFVEKVGRFLREHKEGKAGVPVALLMFLQSWLREHILVTDKAYSSFLNARGVR